MAFFLGETREREGQTFATGEEFKGVTETLGDSWRRSAVRAPAGSGVMEDAPTQAQIDANGRLFTAARRSQELVESWGADRNAIAEAFDNRIETVRRLTGVTLENPERNAYYKEAENDYRLMRDQGAISLADVQNGDNFASRRIGLQRQVFNRKVDELAQSQPDKAAGLAFGQTIEDQANAIARSARSELDSARRDVGGVGGFVTEIGGSLAGISRDPGNIAGLFAGGGLGTAKTLIGRVGQVMLREGLINAGVEALQQPRVQDWKRQLGLEHGLEPALENIGLAFLFGAGIGGGAQGLAEAFGKGVARVGDQDRAAMQAVLRGEASSEEVERVARVMGVKLDDNPELAIARRFEADDATLPEPPAGVSRADHNDALADAMRAAEAPDTMPPPVAPLEASRLRGVLSDRPQLLPYVDEPPQTVLGLAALREDVWRAVQAGEVDPVHASWIGRMAPDAPESHGSLLLALQQAAPETVADARLVIRDAMAAVDRYRQAQSTILGAIDDGLDRLARGVDPQLFAMIDGVEARIAGLRAELGRVQAGVEAGGAAPSRRAWRGYGAIWTASPASGGPRPPPRPCARKSPGWKPIRRCCSGRPGNRLAMSTRRCACRCRKRRWSVRVSARNCAPRASRPTPRRRSRRCGHGSTGFRSTCRPAASRPAARSRDGRAGLG